MTLCQPWTTELEMADCARCDIGGLAAGQAQQIITTASEILYLLTGQQFPGQCDDTVRPCNCSSCGVIRYPVREGGVWLNVCGGCGGYCGVSGAAILLPKRPVISILSVEVDGSVEPDWRLDSPGWLVRTDGGTWPTCQDITADIGEAGTWRVSYLYGKTPPEAMRFAATVLSAELAKACLGDKTCRIPAGAVTVQRQGVTYDFAVETGKTGLYEVDLAIAAFNPNGLKRKARIYNPDDMEWSRTASGS